MTRTFQGLRYEHWLYDARCMQKHMDLHLIDLLERNQLDQALDCIGNPQRFYADVLHLSNRSKGPQHRGRMGNFQKSFERCN
jgi:hypothetical protein